MVLQIKLKNLYGFVEMRTILSPDISQLVKFAQPDNSQLVDLQGWTFLSYLFCRVEQFSVRDISPLIYFKV